eukprot:TRINITY_DN1966_c0_g1_i1.p1 TRINITY_DN1966_c0_g1~~TRINITY_DN1966_c0_g1_i1.p1  ORF type:complete len:414 (-),score=76.68 TRINITY_DN1966_c0_g1_i1:39-1280(-)
MLHFCGVLPPSPPLSLELPTLFPEQNQDVLPALMSGTTASVTLSRAQVRCLLANSFFCNLPSFTDQHRERHYHGFCSVCWRDVYLSKDGVGVERIKCQLNYLHYALIKQRCVTGNIVIHRTCVNAASGGFPAWDTCEAPLLAPAQMHDAVKIELTNAGYQIDFANRDLHIAQIIPSATQEEVLFSIKPELFVGMLLCERMADNEAIIIAGANMYSCYSGYLTTFKFAGPAPQAQAPNNDDAPQVVAIDSVIAFQRNQYAKEAFDRDLNKAWAGFKGVDNLPVASVPGVLEPDVIATGKWGCGAFGCNPYIKFVQQLLAASACNRRLIFSAFDKDLFPELVHLNDAIAALAADQRRQLRVCDLYRAAMDVSLRSQYSRRDHYYKLLMAQLSRWHIAPAAEAPQQQAGHLPEDVV